MNDLTISPESLDIANAYLTYGSIQETANELSIPPDLVANTLEKREVKVYIDQVFLDQGYRNRNKLHAVLDKIIDSKLEEAEETELYSDKDLVEIIQLAHKMRMDEAKLASASRPPPPTIQNNVQVIEENALGVGGKYGKLIEQLLCQND
jgi:hypothetical protein